MTRLMYDDVSVGNYPPSAVMAAGYVDGNWPTYWSLRQQCPHAFLVSITVAGADADVVDVEQGDLSPDAGARWVAWRHSRGLVAIVYCSLSAWADVRAACAALGVTPGGYWIACYDDVATIPDDWAAHGCVAKQYQSTDTYDVSTVLDTWPGITPPLEEEFFPMAIFANDDDARRWFVRVQFNEQLGREPTGDEQTWWTAFLAAHGADLTLAGIRDSTEAQNWRGAHQGLSA